MNNKDKWISIRISEDRKEAIREIAKVYDCKISDIVRIALDEFLLGVE